MMTARTRPASDVGIVAAVMGGIRRGTVAALGGLLMIAVMVGASGTAARADQPVSGPASPGTPPGGSPDAALSDAQAHLATLLAGIAPLQAEVDALRARV